MPTARDDVRLAVRRLLQLPGRSPRWAAVLVACSGGADSLALTGATVEAAQRLGTKVHAVVVDHGLQPDSAQVAQGAVEQALRLGARASAVRVQVRPAGEGPEAAARTARYAALEAAAQELGAPAVLLGHTRDDQAETVLLGLARGSGSRSLAGMPRHRGVFHRPLLDLPRERVRAAASEWGCRPWSDPHNEDHAFARARVRADVLPGLEAALGPGVAAALARTADLLRADAEALEELAAELVPGPGQPLPVARLRQARQALAGRAVRQWLLAAGCEPGRIGAAQVERVMDLVTRWHGQGPVDLPGARVSRVEGLLHLEHSRPDRPVDPRSR